MTETQDFGLSVQDDAAPTLAVAEAWRAEIGGRASVSASDVQDRLLDLWGTLPDGSAKALVESWLTETLERNLYAVADITARLDGVLASA